MREARVAKAATLRTQEAAQNAPVRHRRVQVWTAESDRQAGDQITPRLILDRASGGPRSGPTSIVWDIKTWPPLDRLSHAARAAQQSAACGLLDRVTGKRVVVGGRVRVRRKKRGPKTHWTRR